MTVYVNCIICGKNLVPENRPVCLYCQAVCKTSRRMNEQLLKGCPRTLRRYRQAQSVWRYAGRNGKFGELELTYKDAKVAITRSEARGNFDYSVFRNGEFVSMYRNCRSLSNAKVRAFRHLARLLNFEPGELARLIKEETRNDDEK